MTEPSMIQFRLRSLAVGSYEGSALEVNVRDAANDFNPHQDDVRDSIRDLVPVAA